MHTSFRIRIAKRGRPFIAIDHFEIPRGKLTFLFGESGIGKTLLSKAVYGLLDPATLDIRINDHSYGAWLARPALADLQARGFFVFQEPSSHLNPLMSLEDQLREGTLADAPDESAILQRLWRESGDARMREILRVYPKPYRPSGGEKQRILLAMAFKKLARMRGEGGDPGESLFVFDEPTGSLDNRLRNRFLDMLMEHLAEFPATAMLITHDYSMISHLMENHAARLEQVAFRELARDGDGLIQRDFDPRRYLDWIASTRTEAAPPPAGSEPVLNLKSGYRVFGRRMGITRGDARDTETPLVVRPGEMVYLKAGSGVGKTTLARIVMGLQPCEDLHLSLGSLTLTDASDRRDWRRHVWAKRMGMVFQHADESLNLNDTVGQAFAGLPVTPRITGDRLVTLLRALFDRGLPEGFLERRIGQLSGGQKQRLNLLRTLALDTPLVILDEPLNGLDFGSMQRVIALLRERQRQGTAILMISHNEEIFDAIIPPSHTYHLSTGPEH